MKKLSLVLSLSILLLGCKKENTTSCPDPVLNCAGVSCLLTYYYFDFRLIDKDTSEDLIFGPSPRYSVSDIELFADAAKTVSIPITADNAQKLFKVQEAQPEMYLVVAGTTSYKISVDFKKIDCCSYRVKNLKIDNQSLCVCCTDAIELKID